MKNVTLLVDDLYHSENIGYVSSTDKMNYNLTLLNDLLSKTNFIQEVNNSKAGVALIHPLGKYILVLRYRKNAKPEIFFCNHQLSYQYLDELLSQFFDPKIINEILRVKYEMEEIYEAADDLIVLMN